MMLKNCKWNAKSKVQVKTDSATKLKIGLPQSALQIKSEIEHAGIAHINNVHTILSAKMRKKT